MTIAEGDVQEKGDTEHQQRNDPSGQVLLHSDTGERELWVSDS